MAIYAKKLADGLGAAIDTGRLAGAWQALHPKDVTKAAGPGGARLLYQGPEGPLSYVPEALDRPETAGFEPATYRTPTPASYGAPTQGHATKAINPLLSTFLARAREAILAVLRRILPQAWTEGWALGQLAADAVLGGLEAVDWGAWTPGDYAAAEAIAGAGLRQLLAEADITIRSIAESRLEELAAVLEATLASDITERPLLPEPLPPMLSVGDLARQLQDVLDNPQRAELVAQAEIGRAQAEAARREYAEAGTTDVEISTAEDDKVCPVCEAARAVGAHPLGTPPMVLLHPRCRCAELPVLAGAS